jgi:tRNA A37 N6-isopentenylltransferase MiaA
LQRLRGHKEEADRNIKTIAESRAEIERLNARIRHDAEAALRALDEIDQLTESKAALQTEIERLRALDDKKWTAHVIEREDLKMALIKATAENAQRQVQWEAAKREAEKLLRERNDEIARLRGFNTKLEAENARLRAEIELVSK